MSVGTPATKSDSLDQRPHVFIDPDDGKVYTTDPQAWISLCCPPRLDPFEPEDPGNPVWNERWTLTGVESGKRLVSEALANVA